MAVFAQRLVKYRIRHERLARIPGMFAIFTHRDNLYIRQFSLEHFAEILQVEIRREVRASAHFNIDIEYLSHGISTGNI